MEDSKTLMTINHYSKTLRAGDNHYRAYVGPPDRYDLMAGLQFGLMLLLGLREQHTIIDIGCGSLRAGRLFIPYLNKGNYYGIEPEKWLIEDAISNEIGRDMIRIKEPHFIYDSDYSLEKFGVRFDFFIAQSIFSHAPVSEIERCLSAVRSTMHKDSLLAATFVEGDSDYAGNDWVYPTTIKYQPMTILNMIEKNGLVTYRTKYFHPSQTWFLIGLPSSRVKVERYAKIINRMMNKELLDSIRGTTSVKIAFFHRLKYYILKRIGDSSQN